LKQKIKNYVAPQHVSRKIKFHINLEILASFLLVLNLL